MEDKFNSEKPKRIPFKVPEDYFKELPIRINDRVTSPNSIFLNRSIKISLGLKWALYAISVIFLISIAIWSYVPSGERDIDVLLADVPQETIQDYLELAFLYDEDVFSTIDGDFLYTEDLLPEDFEIFEDEIEMEDFIP
jgi:hypothetical protein